LTHVSLEPAFTRHFEDPNDFVPESGSAYIYGETGEPRSAFANQLRNRNADQVLFIRVTETARGVVEADLIPGAPLSMRSLVDLRKLIETVGRRRVYVDITGMAHSVWAPIVKSALAEGMDLRAIYFEPKRYTVSLAEVEKDARRRGETFDLSETYEKPSPLPLFASLDTTPDDQVLFIPMLGFEGPRFEHILNEMQASPGLTYPIIGAPGYLPHYPIDTFVENAQALLKWNIQGNVRHAQSNCPFSAYYTIGRISGVEHGRHCRIALLGTKPHALGGVLHAIRNPESSELVFDHATRKKGRTEGVSRCLVFGLRAFWDHLDTLEAGPADVPKLRHDGTVLR